LISDNLNLFRNELPRIFKKGDFVVPKSDWKILCGNVIGIGGLSKVFELGWTKHLCVKVAWKEGPSVSQKEMFWNQEIEDSSDPESDVYLSEIVTWSSGQWAATYLSPNNINQIIKSEYLYLTKFRADHPDSTLYPRVMGSGQINDRFFLCNGNDSWNDFKKTSQFETQ
jgi:hypothetical protein